MNYQIFRTFKFFMVLCKKMYNIQPSNQICVFHCLLIIYRHTSHTHSLTLYTQHTHSLSSILTSCWIIYLFIYLFIYLCLRFLLYS